MPKWIQLPQEKFYTQPSQLAFLTAKNSRTCTKCTLSYVCTPPITICPACGAIGKRQFDRLTILAGRRFGKGLALNTPIPSPSGWTTLGALIVGDVIFDENGQPTVITAVSPINHIECFKITFSDGHELVADADHTWLTWSKAFRKAARRSKTPHVKPEVKQTPDLIYEENNRDAIPLCGVLQYPTKQLPIPPYTLGVWLGDGDSASSTLTSVDRDIITNIEQDGFEVRQDKNPVRWSIDKRKGQRDILTGQFTENGSLHSTLRATNLLHNKHVPSDYLIASSEQRLALLQGLLDTDGHCDKRGLIEFTSTNQQLAESVQELATGFGWRPSFCTGRDTLYGQDCGPKYRVFFWATRPAFRLPRKLQRQQFGFKSFFPVRYITHVKPVASVPTKCIMVSASSSLFLAGKGCIPTHNSRIGAIAGAQEATVPYSVGWACAPTVPKLHRYVIPAFQQLIPTHWVKSWNAEFLDLRLTNGALIHFQTLEDPDQGRGQGLDWLLIDEVCELTKNHWEVIRPSLAGDTVAFFTTTPRGFDFVYDELYKPAENGVPGYWACIAPTSSSANPDITPEFLAREKAQMSDQMYRQEYEADFVVFQGAIYGGSIEPQVLRDNTAIRNLIPEWPSISSSRQVLVGIDTGADHPFGALKLVVTESGIVAVGEYLERHKSFIEHAASIRALATSHGPSPVRYAINKNERQAMIELSVHGINCERAQNDHIAGIERVKSWLHTHQLYFIESLVPHAVKQLKSYRFDENYSPKDEQKKFKERVYKKEDELPDCLRYALMCWPQLPKIAAISTERDISKLPAEAQASIMRMRRIEHALTLKEGDTVGDFWG